MKDNQEVLLRKGAFALCWLTEEFDATSESASDNAGGADLPDFWPGHLELGTDSRQVGFNGPGLDVMTHVDNVKA